ncbi:hypothetical protein HAX54_052606 [Datura stramonium]|uniref:Uncharacterized protein n=1 Tax=Datura stramonium TaxID=4076 RepID=A0ABS8SZS3_DATST|nr:hypothetical protein [Datura stramonium]
MYAQEDGPSKFDWIFALMDQSDADESEEVSFCDRHKDLKTLSKKELRALVDVLIDAYYGIVDEKAVLTTELDQSKKARRFLGMENTRFNEEIKELIKDKVVVEYNLIKYMEGEHSEESSLSQVPGEGQDSQETSCIRANEHGGSDSKLNGQQSDVHTPSPSNGS